MNILLTNDDGIDSEGLRVLANVLRADHEIWIVAPDGERSGSSHSVTLKEPTKIHRVSDREYSCEGTPADCVIIAVLAIVPKNIDLVISGINKGPNLGTDITYSGTAAAARQGALMGKPSIAASINSYEPPFRYKNPANFLADNIKLFKTLWSDDHFLNINFPNNMARTVSVEITYPVLRIYNDKIETFRAPNGDLYCFLGGDVPSSKEEEGTDSYAVSSGRISMSPILIHPTNEKIEQKYRGVFPDFICV
ncbi:MAG: 5'/3'-nucleotidase SurE [Spirochaetales bacterium]|nr:5'/3'-nucleotidase SurE [Spirochaetales bacterium]